jgi:hypothetical protein
MADCDLLDGGIELGCDNNIPGIRNIWFTEKSNVTAIGLSSPGDKINSFTMAGSPAAVFYKFEFNKNTSSYTESESDDQAAGRTLNTITINLVLNRREKAKRDKLMLLGKRKDLVAIIEDNNGLYFYAGQEYGINKTTNEGGSGVAKTDVNQYVITFVGEEPELMNEIEEAAVLAVIE